MKGTDLLPVPLPVPLRVLAARSACARLLQNFLLPNFLLLLNNYWPWISYEIFYDWIYAVIYEEVIYEEVICEEVICDEVICDEVICEEVICDLRRGDLRRGDLR